MHALILADGEPPSRAGLDAAWPRWDRDVAFVVAADGGARYAPTIGRSIDLWIGDGDSVDPSDLARLDAAGIRRELAAIDKDETDTELAVRAAIAHGAARLTIVGALGGPRIDHALANVSLLAMVDDGLEACLLTPSARVRLVRGPRPDGSPARLDLEGRPGDLVSLLPWGGDASGVTTAGLRFALTDEPLVAGRTRGVSNVRTTARAALTVRDGHLVVVETPASL